MLHAQDLKVVLESDAGWVQALDGVSLALQRGQTFALVGESGCGKSITALTLMRLLPDHAIVCGGELHLDQDDLLSLRESGMRRVRGRRIGIIFQEPATSLNPVLTVGQQIIETLITHTEWRGPAARTRALAWLRRVGLPEPERQIDCYPFELSGGQKQRAMMAIALAAEPDFLVADEPTTALDVTIQKQILDLLQDLQRERGLGLLLITHDLAVVCGIAQHVALMYAGQIVEVARAADFFARPRHPYAQALLRALPGADQRGRALEAIAGSVPPLTQQFVGCRFAARCLRVEPRCHNQAPPLLPVAPDHQVRCWLASEPQPSLDARSVPAQPRSLGAAAPSGLPAVLDVQALSVRYPQRGLWPAARRPGYVAVDQVSLALPAGRTLALVGESGCGKTTLGRAVMQLLRGRAHVEGQTMLDGRDLMTLHGAELQAARRQIQIVFQDPFASLNPRLRVQEILEEGMVSLRPQWSAAERRERVLHLVERVGLRPDALMRWPHEFSGGQRQRLAIARALAVEPRVLVCDEPTSALDVSVQAQILNLLQDLQAERGLAYLFITHNISLVEYLADTVAVMRQGRIIEMGAAATVLQSPSDAYTRSLLAAVPRLDLRGLASPADF